MLQINKLRADHVIDFAAEELKKYLRMMLPRCGEIDIRYDPDATDGFRLGLLEDFALPSEAVDPVLDDVIHVDTDCNGGILAGSNPRSVLFGVYRLLRENGCRWLYPGVDGEHVPLRDITPQKYHKKADHRFRGHCNEGAESQQAMLETIEFVRYMPKLEVAILAMDYWSDCSPLAECPELEYLEIQTTKVSDISALSGLTKLKHLNICYLFDLTDISPLYGLTQLERLWIGCLTPIPDEQVEKMQELAPDCVINTRTLDPTDDEWRYSRKGGLVPRYELLREQFGGYVNSAFSFPWNDPLYKEA